MAHHSAAAEFDTSKPITLQGKVTKVEWMNPHVHFWMDVAGVNWELESVAPNYLQREGWTRQSLKPGDIVTVRAYVAKDQPNLAKTAEVTLSGGKRIITGVASSR
jgi:hypothetical protein